MNAIGVSIVWATMQITVIGFVTAALYFAARRLGARLAATTIFSGLCVMAFAVSLTFCPLPNWSISLPAVLLPSDAATSVQPPVAQGQAEVTAAPSVSNWTTLVQDIWLEEMAQLDELDQATRAEGDSQMGTSPFRWRWTGMFAILSLAAIGFGVGRLILGLLAARRYARGSVKLDAPDLCGLIDVLKARLGCQATIAIKEHEQLESAATIGWWRPVVLLPRSWRDWNPIDLQAVLAHELAHIHHRDFFGWVCAQIFVAVQFFHPLAHWLAGRLRLEQELAADAVAAEIAGGRNKYLTSLAGLALHRDDVRLSWSAQAFLPTRRSFLRRIEMLRSKRRGSVKGQQRLRPVVIGLLIATGFIIVGWRRPEFVSIATPALAAQAASSQRTTESAAPNLPFDLNYVPRDAVVVAAIRPSRLMAQTEFSALAKQFKAYQAEDPSMLDAAALEVARLILLPTNENGAMKPNGVGIMLRFNQPTNYVLETFTEVAGEFSRFEIRKSRSHYAAKIDDRMVLIANDLPVLRRMLAAGENLPGSEPWVAKWRANAEKDAVVAVNIARMKPMFDVLKSGREGDGPAQVLQAINVLGPIWEDSKFAVTSLSLAAPMNGLVDLAANHEKAAKESAETVKALVTLGRNMLSGVRDSASRNDGEMAAAALQFADLGDSVLDTIHVKRTGANVTAEFSLDSEVVQSAATILVPATTAARTAARRAQDMNSVRQVILGLLNYESANGHFPAATMLGPDGKTVHSWRVAILPYLEHADLYEAYRLDEPWDSPHNKKLLSNIPSVYRSASAPRGSTNSSVYVFTGEDAAFNGKHQRHIREIRDGTSKTVFVVEAQRDIPWTKPEDIPFDLEREIPQIIGHRPTGSIVGFGDGSVRFVPKGMAGEDWKKLITHRGSEPIGGF